MSVQRDIAYGPRAQQVLDVCSPAAQGLDRPAVILLHGGAWKGGDRADFEQVCRAYATAGIVALPIGYRLIDGTPESAWPAQLSDAQLAVRWVKSHARELGVDPDRVCAQGRSAGAHLAALLGATHQIAPGDMSALLAQISPDVACVIDVSGPVDLVALATPGHKAVAKLLGTKKPGEMASRAAQASPMTYIGPDTAPTLIVHGVSDPVVPYSQAETYFEALQQAGVPVWFLSHQGEHVLKGMSPEKRRLLMSIEIEFVLNHRLEHPSRWSVLTES